MIIKNSNKYYEYLIFLGLVFPAFGIGAFGGELFFFYNDKFYIIIIGIIIVGFFEGFYIVLFTPVLMQKI